jgi:hypothetical protein
MARVRPWDSPSPGAVVINTAVWGGFLLLFGLSTAAGVLLITRESLGRALSCIVQGLQLPIVNIGGVSYWFIVGCSARVELKWPGPETYLTWSNGSEAGIFMRAHATPAILGFNALALAFFLLTALAGRPAKPDGPS